MGLSLGDREVDTHLARTLFIALLLAIVPIAHDVVGIRRLGNDRGLSF